MKSLFKLPVILTILFSALIADESVQKEELLKTIQNEILIKDSRVSVQKAKAMVSALQSSESPLQKGRAAFAPLILSWKKVQALYIAGQLNEDIIDKPRYIDIFHGNNEDFRVQIDRIITGKNPPEIALFRNSHNTVNALEYLLFAKHPDGMETRVLTLARYIAENIEKNLREIADFYAEDTRFVADGEESLSDIINILVDSTYKLATWRVGDPAGLTFKYEGKPSADRLEYLLSNQSAAAMRAILEVHKKVMDDPEHIDMGDLGMEGDAAVITQNVRAAIDQAMQTLQSVPSPLSGQLEKPIMEKLHKDFSEIYNLYYFKLISAMGLKSRIIDADGD